MAKSMLAVASSDIRARTSAALAGSMRWARSTLICRAASTSTVDVASRGVSARSGRSAA
jgi:hypothetical protein